ncbi:hypothetical protein [Sphingomonas sp. NPDC079357]|uniref:hypothetical protein n=1 Tax=Sphingomonas sp. NPDC079357 TaxID=3364518 RepID=UPI00384D9E63
MSLYSVGGWLNKNPPFTSCRPKAARQHLAQTTLYAVHERMSDAVMDPHGIDQNVGINRALWMLAEGMARLKA